MRRVQFLIRLKDCHEQFHHDLEPGVVATRTIDYPVDQETPVLAASIVDDGQQLLRDTVEVEAREIPT